VNYLQFLEVVFVKFKFHFSVAKSKTHAYVATKHVYLSRDISSVWQIF